MYSGQSSEQNTRENHAFMEFAFRTMNNIVRICSILVMKRKKK